MNIECYIFDFDNTLCDSTDISLMVYRKVFQHFSIPFNAKNITTYLGESLKKTFSDLNVSSVSFDDFREYFFKVSDRLFPANVKLFESAIELLHFLKEKGIKTAIVTSKNKSTLLLILQKHNTQELFDCIISYEDVDHHKPHPEGIEICLKRLGVKDKQKVLYIGDTVNDMLAAKSAGVRYIDVNQSIEGTVNIVKTDFKSIYTSTLLSAVPTNNIGYNEISKPKPEPKSDCQNRGAENFRQ